MRIVEYKSQAELLNAFIEGELKGSFPAETIDTNKLEYPVKIEISGVAKFRIYREVKVETSSPSESTIDEVVGKKKLSKKAIILLATCIPCGIALIVGIVLLCVLL